MQIVWFRDIKLLEFSSTIALFSKREISNRISPTFEKQVWVAASGTALDPLCDCRPRPTLRACQTRARPANDVSETEVEKQERRKDQEGNERLNCQNSLKPCLKWQS